MSNNAGPRHPWRANGKAIRGRKPLPEGYLAAHQALYGVEPKITPVQPVDSAPGPNLLPPEEKR